MEVHSTFACKRISSISFEHVHRQPGRQTGKGPASPQSKFTARQAAKGKPMQCVLSLQFPNMFSFFAGSTFFFQERFSTLCQHISQLWSTGAQDKAWRDVESVQAHISSLFRIDPYSLEQHFCLTPSCVSATPCGCCHTAACLSLGQGQIESGPGLTV